MKCVVPALSVELLPQFALRPVTEGELKITKTLPIVHYMQKWKEEFLSSILQLSPIRIKECLFGMFESPFFSCCLSPPLTQITIISAGPALQYYSVTVSA